MTSTRSESIAFQACGKWHAGILQQHLRPIWHTILSCYQSRGSVARIELLATSGRRCGYCWRYTTRRPEIVALQVGALSYGPQFVRAEMIVSRNERNAAWMICGYNGTVVPRHCLCCGDIDGHRVTLCASPVVFSAVAFTLYRLDDSILWDNGYPIKFISAISPVKD